jgi:hypothetical protein
MYEQAFTITIKPAEESQLEVLEQEFSLIHSQDTSPYDA